MIAPGPGNFAGLVAAARDLGLQQRLPALRRGSECPASRTFSHISSGGGKAAHAGAAFIWRDAARMADARKASRPGNQAAELEESKRGSPFVGRALSHENIRSG